MKRTVKKIAAVGLTLTSVMSLVACKSNAGDNSTTAAKKEVTFPTGTIKVMVDNTVLSETNGGKEFYAYLKSLDGGLNIEWNRPEHSSYYDQVGISFNSTDMMPDVVLLSADYYSLYASMGFLWDMTDAWNNSETKNSGRLISTADNVLDALVVNGEDGKAMYGFSPYRGNGCVTFVKEAWLTQAGMKRSDIENKQLSFKEYYDMLLKMKNATGKTVVSASGFIGNEAPYTNYLPEFYQQAQFTFYADSTGKYVDGFSQQAMKDALVRIQTAVKDGVLDQESVNLSTSNVRDKFKDDKIGVFTYWAGTWAQTLTNNLAAAKLDSSLIAIKPIKELGAYVERIAPAWCITTEAENPEGIFKYFIDKMLDGGDIQMAWEYGAKGTHWDTKAETVTLKNGKEGTEKTYKDGEFHMLPSPEDPTKLTSKNHIDPMLALATFKDGVDPGLVATTELTKTNAQFFYDNSTVAVPVPMTTELSEYINDINTKRKQVIADVAMGKDVNTAMNDYTSSVGSLVDKVLKSLNK